MYSFIPRLPTKQAWATKEFQPQTTLQAIVEAVKGKSPYYTRGQLMFKDDTILQFSSSKDLELQLMTLKWDASKITKIVLYQYGYFIIN